MPNKTGAKDVENLVRNKVRRDAHYELAIEAEMRGDKENVASNLVSAGDRDKAVGETAKKWGPTMDEMTTVKPKRLADGGPVHVDYAPRASGKRDYPKKKRGA